MDLQRAHATIAVAVVLAIAPPSATHGQTTDGERLAFGASSAATPADLAAAFDEIRRATAKYRDVQTALAEGYLRDPTNQCIVPAMEGLPAQLGAMGIHFFRPDLLGITATQPRIDGAGTHTDFTRPGVLIYEPQADGSLELIAVENLVFEKPWREAGNSAPPRLADLEFYHMVDNPRTAADEAHGFEPHYEMHLWLFRENPSGVAAQFNPNVTCGHHPTGHAH